MPAKKARVKKEKQHAALSEKGMSSSRAGREGGKATASTERIGIGVSCPIVRGHPAVVAQAAAPTSLLFDGRFFLGVGTGEALNEHVVGLRWPKPEVCVTNAVNPCKWTPRGKRRRHQKPNGREIRAGDGRDEVYAGLVGDLSVVSEFLGRES